MKKFAIFVYLALITFAAFAAGPQRKIAFERGDNVWVANLDGTDAKKIASGSLPNISPDATRLAFNTDADSKTRPGPERHIAIADLASGKVTGPQRHSKRQLLWPSLVAGRIETRVLYHG